MPSLLAAIGDVIERHMIEIGFLPPNGKAALEHRAAPAGPAPSDDQPQASMLQCPKCGAPGLIRQEGCDVRPSLRLLQIRVTPAVAITAY